MRTTAPIPMEVSRRIRALRYAMFLGAAVLHVPTYGQGSVSADAAHRVDFVEVPALHVDRVVGAPDACPLPDVSVQIGRFEVTNIEYAAFLNAVARLGDPHGLYNELQENHFWGGIIRSKSAGGYVYSVKPGYGDLPATYVSAHDAIRFANWMHFGQPSTGTSGPGTTEGTATSGAYDTTAMAEKSVGLRRNAGARYFLPSCGEWKTAAFFDPKTGSFSEFSGGNTAPLGGSEATAERSANYYAGKWAVPFPHLASVASYENNRSPLGTLNQSGNVMEWVEGFRGNGQMALGGSLFMPRDTLSKGYVDSEFPGKKLSSFGFRIARAEDVQESLVFSAPVADEDLSPPEPVASSVGSKTDWTLIDRPGNFSDPRTGHGCVAKNFEMARTEVTNSQFVAFLNAVASQGDPHSLYLEDMTTGIGGGIVRTFEGQVAAYSVKPGYENRPAPYLSWFTLARLANWHHFGRPIGKQVLGITEGDETTGAYDTRGFASFEQENRKGTVSATMFTRNPGAKYFLPTNDEWYKAAYYDPEKPGPRKYWHYTNRSNTPPGNEPDAKGANHQVSELGEGAPYYLSEAGRFASRGYYDLADMGGNVWEWLETWKGLGGQTGWRADIPTKGLRGGSFNYIDIGLYYGNIDPGYPSDHYFVYGGRLARGTAATGESGWCFPPEMRTAFTLQKAYDHRRLIGTVAASVLLAITWLLWMRRRWSRRDHRGQDSAQ